MNAPSPTYWHSLGRTKQSVRLRELFERRWTEFTASDLGPQREPSVELLDRLTRDGFLERIARPVEDTGELEIIYVRRDVPPARSVDWVVAVHGMNTTGAWQEAFSWLFATTWGRSVPVAVYKYGIVLAGVVLSWRRGAMREELRERIATLREEAVARDLKGKPDLIAHSFGTWLFGHMLEHELTREHPLTFGRVILTGSILRPDFPWRRFKDAGLVEDVLNHYGTGDRVVPCAHFTIHDSGPSGRRGFDGGEVINVRAEGLGHSDLFALENLEHSYRVWWKPFLTLPREELAGLRDIANPSTPWRAWWWPFRGTLFPFVALPLVFGLGLFLFAAAGHFLWRLLLWLRS